MHGASASFYKNKQIFSSAHSLDYEGTTYANFKPCLMHLLFKTTSVLLVQHKTRGGGVSCRITSKEEHAEKSGLVLCVLAAHLSLCSCVCNMANFRELSSAVPNPQDLLLGMNPCERQKYELIQ
jgi:hypothetical protein